MNPASRLTRLSCLALLGLISSFVVRGAQPAELRVGLIGLDTSHVIAFTNLLNNDKDPNRVPGARVVAGFKGGSPDVTASATRVDNFTKELVDKWGIKLYDTIEELARNVDAIMIESVDGRVHLEQARKVFPFRKPVFIDKPVAGSLRDAIEIYRLAKQHGVPVFSSSPLRFAPAIDKAKSADIGKLQGALTHGPATLEPHHPDLFWYGVHATEILYTFMGRGCERVSRTHTTDTDVITGVWADGRVGTVWGSRPRPQPSYGLVAFGAKAMVQELPAASYPNLIASVVNFFRTGQAPVSTADTIEIFAFMEAADESKRRGGAPVTIAEILKANGGTPDLIK